MPFKDLSSETPPPANDEAKTACMTPEPGKAPAQVAPAPKRS